MEYCLCLFSSIRYLPGLLFSRSSCHIHTQASSNMIFRHSGDFPIFNQCVAFVVQGYHLYEIPHIFCHLSQSHWITVSFNILPSSSHSTSSRLSSLRYYRMRVQSIVVLFHCLDLHMVFFHSHKLSCLVKPNRDIFKLCSLLSGSSGLQ